MFRGPRGLIFTLLGAAAIIAAAVFFGIQGQKDDADTSRLFMTHLAAGEYAEAHGLLHASATEQTSVQQLGEIFSGLDTYSTISFPEVSFSTTNGTRRTELSGTGTTDDGCESALQFELLNGAITFMDVSPLCRSGATDT